MTEAKQTQLPLTFQRKRKLEPAPAVTKAAASLPPAKAAKPKKPSTATNDDDVVEVQKATKSAAQPLTATSSTQTAASDAKRSRAAEAAALEAKRLQVERAVAEAAKSIRSELIGNWKEESDQEIVLRRFDLDLKFGPCSGITRVQRWLRAQRQGLNPPKLVKDILDLEASPSSSCWENPTARVLESEAEPALE